MPALSFPYGNLAWLAGTRPPFSPEGFMLDVVFITLGFVVVALMAAYAAGLRQL